MTVQVEFEYSDDKKTQHRKANEIKLKQELVSIEKRNAQIVAESKTESEEDKTELDGADVKTTTGEKTGSVGEGIESKNAKVDDKMSDYVIRDS